MHLLTCLLPLFASLAHGAQREPSPERYWALVHACDEVARASIMNQKSVSDALRVAGTLGYEAILDENTFYLYPIPAWSLDENTSLLGLLTEGNLITGKPRAISELPKHQADHLQSILSNSKVGGSLGELMRATKSGKVSLVKSVDVKITLRGQEHWVPITDERLTRLFFGKPERNSKQSEGDMSYPSRPALFGLMKSNFAVSPSYTTSPASFNKVVNRATELLRERQDSARKELLRQIYAVTGSNASELGGRLLGSEGVPFSSLPRDVQTALGEAVARNPDALALQGGISAGQALDQASISVPPGGVRVILEFLLDGTLPASDGSPVRYRVGWELKDLPGSSH